MPKNIYSTQVRRTDYPNRESRACVKVESYRKHAEKPIRDLWAEHQMISKVSPDSKERREIKNKLINNYLPLVNSIAIKLHSKLPKSVDLDDLKIEGSLGLGEAVDGFKTERGIRFEAYADKVIRGRMIDYLRENDWVPRLVRSRTAKLEAAKGKFFLQYGRKPTEEELRESLRVSREDFRKIKKDGITTEQINLSPLD